LEPVNKRLPNGKKQQRKEATPKYNYKNEN
jgi:hypothetical protein